MITHYGEEGTIDKLNYFSYNSQVPPGNLGYPLSDGEFSFFN